MMNKQVRRTLQEYIASKKGNLIPIGALLESFNLQPSDIDDLIRTTLNEEGDPLIHFADDGKHVIDSGKLKSWLSKNAI